MYFLYEFLFIIFKIMKVSLFPCHNLMSWKNLKKKILYSKKGFTLIETLVVIALIAVIFSFMGKNMLLKGSRITDTFRFFSVLNRRLYTAAKLHREVYRLVIKIDDKKPEEVWVEKKLKDSELLQVKEQEKSNSKESVKEYEKDPSFLKKPRKIFPLLSITSVESPYWKETKPKKMVYIYYYPKGPGPEAAFHFKREDNQAEWTLYFPPLQRELKLIKNNISLENIKKEL